VGKTLYFSCSRSQTPYMGVAGIMGRYYF